MSACCSPLTIPLGAGSIGALLDHPADARAGYVFAHGAGAGMAHTFMEAIASGLAERHIATLRFQFPYMEQGSRRPDSPKVAHAAVRAAVHEAAGRLAGLPLFAGGKSYGGRMTSQAQALAPLETVRGLVFVGFPLHPAGKPSSERAAHLAGVRLPMLFLQGTRDALADLELIRSTTGALKGWATLHVVDGADHSFKVPASARRRPSEVQAELLDTMAGWMLKAGSVSP